MKRTNLLAKASILVLSVLLAGGFVAFRAGAFATSNTDGAADDGVTSNLILSGTKSAGVPTSELDVPVRPTKAEPSVTIMTGSKSFLPTPAPSAPPAKK